VHRLESNELAKLSSLITRLSSLHITQPLTTGTAGTQAHSQGAELTANHKHKQASCKAATQATRGGQKVLSYSHQQRRDERCLCPAAGAREQHNKHEQARCQTHETGVQQDGHIGRSCCAVSLEYNWCCALFASQLGRGAVRLARCAAHSRHLIRLVVPCSYEWMGDGGRAQVPLLTLVLSSGIIDLPCCLTCVYLYICSCRGELPCSNFTYISQCNGLIVR
jgi:hypothetical protein